MKNGEIEKAAAQQSAAVAELTGLNEKLSTERAALEKQVAQLRQSSEQARAELAELKARAASSDRLAQENLATINELGATNEKLQTQLKDLGTRINAVQAENARLAAAAESGAGTRTELNDVKARLAEALKGADQNGSTVAELTGANDRLTANLKELQEQLNTLRKENTRLAASDQARLEAERRVESLSAAANQLATAQRELASARAEVLRLTDTVQTVDRDRSSRIAQLQQENAAINARLRQAQGTLDQIASAARLINGGSPLNSAPSSGLAGSIPTIPVAPAAAPAPARVHVVAEGDSLTRISARYYGTTNRWQDIYDANRDVLKGENALRPGQRLKIP